MKCTTFDIAFEIAELIEKEDTVFRCEYCKGTIHNFLWECKTCGSQVCTYCLMHQHLHGKNKIELDEVVYLKIYKERDEARKMARQEEIRARETIRIEKNIEKANQRISKEEIRFEKWKERRKDILSRYGVKK